MQRHSVYTLTTVQIIAMVILIWIIFRFPAPWNAQRYAGTVLVFTGIAFIVLARYELGRSFSIKAEAHQLVTSGIYSRIRNPIYVFGCVLITGVILVFQKPILWLILPVLIIGQTNRARREARVLEAAFGDEYREYRRKTWF
jgi:protein-S-isoprenylcysteine O-methyltransferase Ste14